MSRTWRRGTLFLALLFVATASRGAELDWTRILGRYRSAQAASQRGSHETARWLYRQAARLPFGTPELQRRAVDRLNFHRRQAMLVPVMPDPRIARAAEAHAAYLMRHTEDGELTLRQAHSEVPGRAGFTGEGPGDRIRRQGYDGGASEAISSSLEPEEAVDHLVNSVYHRSALFRPEARLMGFAVGNRAVINLAWGRGDETEGDLWYYPGPGQEGVPPRFPGGETPDPLPDATYPVGSPLSIGTAGAMPTLEWARLEGPAGAVRLRILREGSAPRADLMGDFLYLMPEEPLAEDTRYRARARVLGPDGKRRSLDWSFTTGSEVPGSTSVSAEVTDLSYTPDDVTVGTRMHFRAELEASHPERVKLRWSVDGRTVADGAARTFDWVLPDRREHEIRATAHYGEWSTARGSMSFSLGLTPSPSRPLVDLPEGHPNQEIWAVRVLSLTHVPEDIYLGSTLVFRVDFEATHPDSLRIRWTVNGRVVSDGTAREIPWKVEGVGDQQIEVEGYYPEVPGAFGHSALRIHLPEGGR